VQKNYGVKFTAFSSALPSKIVTNKDLEKLFDTTDEWIYTRTGIKERRVVSGNETGVSLSAIAARDVLAKAKLDPKDLDLIILATTTPDKLYPSMSCLLQGELGASNAFCFDLSAACSGFVYGIITAAQYIYNGSCKNILVVGVDIHSRFLDWSERSVAVLFGDGAGAVLIQNCLPQDDELMSYLAYSAGDLKLDLTLPNENIIYPNICKEINPNFVKMNGKAIYQFAVKVVPDIVTKILDKTSLKLEQIDYLVLHQANQRIIDTVSEKIGFNSSRVISTIEKVGNTSAASIPLAIVDSISSGKIVAPCKMLLIGFGAGLTWGALLINWHENKNI